MFGSEGIASREVIPAHYRVYSSRQRQAIVLNAFEDRPDIPMLDDYAVTKQLSIFWQVFFDPGLS